MTIPAQPHPTPAPGSGASVLTRRLGSCPASWGLRQASRGAPAWESTRVVSGAARRGRGCEQRGRADLPPCAPPVPESQGESSMLSRRAWVGWAVFPTCTGEGRRLRLGHLSGRICLEPQAIHCWAVHPAPGCHSPCLFSSYQMPGLGIHLDPGGQRQSVITYYLTRSPQNLAA